jgi:hypothetical protein
MPFIITAALLLARLILELIGRKEAAAAAVAAEGTIAGSERVRWRFSRHNRADRVGPID